MQKKTITLIRERATKRMIRFAEQSQGQPEVIGTLYVAQWFAGNANKATVTIELEGGEQNAPVEPSKYA